MKNDLQAISKELKALSYKVDKLIVTAGKSEKTKTIKKTKVKPVKKAAAKKNLPKSKPAKKVAVRKPAPKKAIKVTATDTVFAVIKESKNGLN